MSNLKLGVIGVGHLGRHHARILATTPGVTLVGVADTRLEQAIAIAEPLATRAFADHRELLPLVDAVSIAVPTRFHHAIATEALSRRIPTLVEKPLASNLGEAESLVALARQEQTLLHVGHIERYNPVLGILRDARITPRYVAAERLGTYTFRSTDIGVVHDLMIHDIDILLSLVESPVSTISAIGVNIFGGLEDVASARIGFENGSVADLSASRASLHATRKVRVWGPEGYAGHDFKTGQGLVVRPSELLRQRKLSLDGVDLTQPDALKNHVFNRLLLPEHHERKDREPLALELEDFLNAIRTGAPPRVTGHDALRAMRLADLVLKAIQAHDWTDARTPDLAHTEHAIPGPHVLRLDSLRKTLERGGKRGGSVS
jgi:predicted dehydrogenase